jgi:flagellin
VDQLVTEIDRVSETTKFNETYLLKGDKDVTAYGLEYGADVQYYDANGNKIAANGLLNYFDVADDGQGTVTITQKANTPVYDETGAVVNNAADGVAEVAKTGALMLTLHVGADATENNQISVAIDAMSTEGLGLVNDDGKLLVNGSTDANALAAIDSIKEAIQQVSTQRSALGAVQNRLEHTIANLDNVVENTTAAESQIRDTDMATEMVRYSNNNILAQAGQAMLAQANQANQGVLSLLQ